MDPEHFEKELQIHIEYLEGYIKKLKKKNITDEEREKVRNLFFLNSFPIISHFLKFISKI
jgi:hypothetical protein